MDEKINKVKELKKKLFIEKKHGASVLNESQMNDVHNFAEKYKKFLSSNKTEREVVQFTADFANKKGFKKYEKGKTYKSGDKVYFIHKNKSIILTVFGKNDFKKGINIAIAHIDCPRLDIKPMPLYENNSLAYFKTHYYGGIKKYQWVAMPLSLHGRIVKLDGSYIDIKIGDKEGEECLCITDLLPHLAREQVTKPMSKVFSGENLNALIGSMPYSKDDTNSEQVKLNILKILNDKYNITEFDFMSSELELVPAYNPKDIGFDKSMIGGYGHDDRCCAYSAIEAILNINNVPEVTSMVVLTDKEEIGSDGNTGMKSGFFKYFVEDIIKGYDVEIRDVLTQSDCLSIDVNAGFDPNFANEYDTLNSCYLNKGVVITKYTGSGGKSGTSDASAEYVGQIRKILTESNVLWQMGELGKVDGGGGGTIAKFVANLNLNVIDMGIPVLSMHSPFEIISKIDIYMCYKAVQSFFYHNM